MSSIIYFINSNAFLIAGKASG